MARTLSPFTRLVLLINELKSNKIENLTDVTKCDLLYHTGKLHEEIDDPGQKESAVGIGAQGRTLFSSITAGELARAETERDALLADCKRLKDLL